MIKILGYVAGFIILIAITVYFVPSAVITLPFMILILQKLGVVPK